jgi:hypothetical protein
LNTPTSTRIGRTAAVAYREPSGSVAEPAPVERNPVENRATRAS